MTGRPLATVIIPCGAKHLPLLSRAVHSAYAQTVTTEVLYFIDHEKKGPGYGRNILAERANGLFVITLDADDILMPTFVEDTLRAWSVGSYVYTDWYQGDLHMQAVDCYAHPVPTSDKPQASFHLPPTLMPKSYFQAIGGYDEKLFGAEDTDFFWKANAHAMISRRLPKPLFHYA